MAQNILVNSIIMFQEQLYLLKELTQNHFFICGRDMVFIERKLVLVVYVGAITYGRTHLNMPEIDGNRVLG